MNNLYISDKDLLFKIIKDYISDTNQELLIISPYIQTEILERLLYGCKAKITIITTWKLRDIQFGSSELELYEYCNKNNIYLYLNQRIHLKVFINNYSTCLFGSANVSAKGLALIDNYNYELAAINKLNIEHIIYFKQILNESILVNDKIYHRYKEEFDLLKPLPEIKELDIADIKTESEFLISALPMSYNPDELFKLYSNGFRTDSIEKRDCAIHDILLYEIPLNFGKQDFMKLLNKRFFESKFIIKLLQFICDEEPYFGQVKEWIQSNYQDVPVPSRRDLTGNIQVLYKWIAELSDGKYKIDRPNYSERIRRIK